MGVPVTIDSDDLSVLLHGVAAIKNVEIALRQRDNDHDFALAKPKITEAVERVENAWRGALRKETMPQVYRDPEGDDFTVLLHLARAGADFVGGIPVFGPEVFRKFVGMGLVEIGVHDQRVVFSSGSGAVWSNRSPDQRLRLTARGKEFVPADWDEGEGQTWHKRDSETWLIGWRRRQRETRGGLNLDPKALGMDSP